MSDIPRQAMIEFGIRRTGQLIAELDAQRREPGAPPPEYGWWCGQLAHAAEHLAAELQNLLAAWPADGRR